MSAIKCRGLFLYFFIAVSFPYKAQQNLCDSLLKVLEKLNAENPQNVYSLNDTNKINVLNLLSNHYLNTGDFNNSIFFCAKGVEICEKHISFEHLKYGPLFKKNLAILQLRIGRNYNYKGNYSKALGETLRALKLNEEIGAHEAISTNLNALGVIYKNQKNYPKALEHLFKALEMSHEKGNKAFIASAYTNIGNVYTLQDQFENALMYQFKALKIAEELNNPKFLASFHGNIGITYTKQRNYAQAEEQFLKALSIFEKINDKAGIAECFYQLGNVYAEQIISSPKNLKQTFLQGVKYLNDALDFAKLTGSKDLTAKCYQTLSDIERLTGNPQKSLENYKLYITYRDSLLNEEHTKQSIKAELNYEFDKKEAKRKLEQKIKDDETKRENDKQLAVRNMFIVAFVFMCLLSVFIFRSFRNKQKVNRIISLQKKEVENQKSIVDQKQKQIIDSINYAQRIQSSILPEEKILTQIIPESFIFYKPRDIVSGDFYWFYPLNDGIILVVADCTGHGVPGAFLSMVGSTLLNEIVSHNNITEPGAIIKELSKSLSATLGKNKNNEENTDGMDISVCNINLKERTLQFSGANHCLYLINENELALIEAPVNSINGIFDLDSAHGTYSVERKIEPNTSIVLSTDGYADQVGGEKGKKFMGTKFGKFLTDINSLSAKEQRNELEKTFNAWKGDHKQVDDVLVIGCRI